MSYLLNKNKYGYEYCVANHTYTIKQGLNYVFVNRVSGQVVTFISGQIVTLLEHDPTVFSWVTLKITFI